jgi:hypothetical protein
MCLELLMKQPMFLQKQQLLRTFVDDVWSEDTPPCILEIVTREQRVPRS